MNVPRTRIVRRPVHGVLLLDKGAGVSSNAALQHAKRLFRAEKAGHTGTLDPLATGLLPLCFGAATKFAQASLDADKRYLATLSLGATTTTADLEGEVVRRRDVHATRADVEAACARFVGRIEQLPPMHSALKHDGKPLYAYARAGVEVERDTRVVTVHAIDVVEGEGERWTIDVRCSKGTYIRTLAADIGEALGCGAHLAALRRTASGGLALREAVSLAELESLDEGARDRHLRAPDVLLGECPAVTLSADDAGRFLTGLRRRLPLADAPLVRIYGPGRSLLGSAHVTAGELIPTRLLSPAEIASLAVPLRPCIEEPESLIS
ncbi:MAG: tRNA pseudouridine(55) synthase TruB [Caldimonas sp.]